MAPRALFLTQSTQQRCDWCTHGRWWQPQTSLGQVMGWRWGASWSCSPSEEPRLRQSRQSDSAVLHLPTLGWSHRAQQPLCRCSPVPLSSAYQRMHILVYVDVLGATRGVVSRFNTAAAVHSEMAIVNPTGVMQMPACPTFLCSCLPRHLPRHLPVINHILLVCLDVHQEQVRGCQATYSIST